MLKELHELYYPTHLSATYKGTQILKYPQDLWIYQEMLREIKPDCIIETGTYLGASAMFLADMCDVFGLDTSIYSIDVTHRQPLPTHKRITWILGDSETVDLSMFSQYKKILVILDSDHTCDHVYKEMLHYNKLQPVYMIVEDGIVNGHPILPNFGPGPTEAIQKFMQHNDDYIVDTSKEKFILTQNPGGFLKRK